MSSTEPGMLVTLDKYLQKGVGRDMMLKSIVYPIRLLNYHTDAKEHKERAEMLTTLISNIIDARMLFNAWKHIGAYLTGYRTLTSQETMPWYQRLLLSLSFFCRALEQLSGDLGYIQAHLVKHWHKPRIVWHYKFWKTMSLTCSALLELIKIILIQQKRNNLRRYVSQSPLTATPTSNPTAFPLFASPKGREEEDESMRSAMKWSCLFLFRNLCDMTVYYQWIESYRPNKNLEYTCGFLSGAIGVWLVWRDVQSHNTQKKQIEEKKE